MAPGSATDRGEARPTNQDALLVSPPLFAVADGMGTPPGGEIASHLALDTLKVRFAAPYGAEALDEAAREASRAVWERADAEPALEGMGTTLTAVAVLGPAGIHQSLAGQACRGRGGRRGRRNRRSWSGPGQPAAA
jgi:PPM family protein phosphatase